MKYVLKDGVKSGLIYWQHDEATDMHYIGSRHAAFRVQIVSEKVRKELAVNGIFQAGTTNKGGDAPDCRKVFPSGDDLNELLNTRFTTNVDKLTYRLFIRPDGQHLFANDALITDVETYFEDKCEWHQRSMNDPLVYGNNLAIVTPYRMTTVKGKENAAETRLAAMSKALRPLVSV